MGQIICGIMGIFGRIGILGLSSFPTSFVEGLLTLPISPSRMGYTNVRNLRVKQKGDGIFGYPGFRLYSDRDCELQLPLYSYSPPRYIFQANLALKCHGFSESKA